MKTHILLTVWCYISGEAAGEIWNWSLSALNIGWPTCSSKENGCFFVGHHGAHRLSAVHFQGLLLDACLQINSKPHVCLATWKLILEHEYQRNGFGALVSVQYAHKLWLLGEQVQCHKVPYQTSERSRCICELHNFPPLNTWLFHWG